MTANCAAPKTVAAKKTPARKAVTATVPAKKLKVTRNKAGDIRIRVQLDQRVNGMTTEALDCRSMGHAWQRIPMAGERRLELLARAETETVRVCMRCQSRRRDLYELPTFLTISSQIDYSDGYLIAKQFAGSGRMPRSAAVAASIVAEVPELLAV